MHFSTLSTLLHTLSFLLLKNTDALSIQDTASQAVSDYQNEKYEESIKGFETALVHYRMLKHIDILCGTRCNSPNISKELEMDFEGFDDLVAYGNLIAQANCVKICKEEHPFTKSKIERPRKDFVRDFESRLPYDYLQFSYYQTGQVKKACQAAYTHQQANPDDTQMQENINYYKGLDGVTEDFFVDLEGKPYIELFKSGVQFYQHGEFSQAVDNLEKALADYFKAYDECRSVCYIAKKPETFHGLPQAVVARFIPAIECSLECGKKLRPVVGSAFVDDFLPRLYSYLQFAYYKLDKWDMAVPAAASALLLNPDDVTSIDNIRYYSENAVDHGLDPKVHFQPRPEAIKFHLESKASSDILDLMKGSVDYDDTMEVEEDAPLEDSLIEEISKQIVMEISERLRGDTG